MAFWDGLFGSPAGAPRPFVDPARFGTGSAPKVAEMELNPLSGMYEVPSAPTAVTTVAPAATEAAGTAIAVGTEAAEAGTAVAVTEAAEVGAALTTLGEGAAVVEGVSGGLATPVVAIAGGAAALGIGAYFYGGKAWRSLFGTDTPPVTVTAPVAPPPVPPVATSTITAAPPPPSAPPIATVPPIPVAAPVSPPPAPMASAPNRSVLKTREVNFDFNEAGLSAAALQEIDGEAAAMKAAGVKEVTVDGHADGVGGDDYNLRLSRRRADAVAARLKADGIDVTIKIEAHGKQGAKDGVKDGHMRRVDITPGM